MKVYALTGGVACGKSTAVETFKQQENVIVLDSDEITRILQEPGQPGFLAVQRRFPSVIVKNKLDRQKLADIVFEQSENGERQRKILNGMMQPLITKYIFTELISLWFSHVVCNMFSFSQKNASRELVVIVDAPVFFEMEKRFGKFLMRIPFSAVIVVSTSEEIQRQRLQARGEGCSEQEAKKRIAAQLPLAEKEKLADYVIRNDGTEEELKAKVAGAPGGGLIEKLRREHGGGGLLSSGFNRFALVGGIVLSAALIGTTYLGYVYVWPHFLTIIHALNLMYGLFF